MEGDEGGFGAEELVDGPTVSPEAVPVPREGETVLPADPMCEGCGVSMSEWEEEVRVKSREVRDAHICTRRHARVQPNSTRRNV